MKLSRRVEKLSPYLFVEISKKIAAKKARGEEVISFGIGDPDMPTPDHIIEALNKAALNPVNHHYPESEGMPEFRQAVADWYLRRFGVILDPEKEVVSLIGAKEGIAHIALCLIDTDDIALVPDPGYPVYSTGTRLCGGQPYFLPINDNNHFLPDFDTIPQDILRRAKMLWLNYPNNPTGAIAGLDFFQQAVEFAWKNHLAICHDGPYSEVAFEGYQPVSFLQTPGAKEVGIEFHSFSKTYNMTGWRVGMAAGNASLIDALRRMKSNLDSGVPLAIQRAAIAALTGPQGCIESHNIIYQKRRDMLVPVLNRIGLKANLPQASLYVWARVPEGYTSAEFANDLLDKVNVVVTPGTGYGPGGEGFVRLSLTIADDLLQKGLSRLEEWRTRKI
jgi:LL-diaminopimelate aminotransferase